MKKLLIISDYYYPHWTGISKGMHYLAKYLSEDFKITVLSIKHKKALRNREVKDNIEIIRVNPQFSLSRSKYSVMQITKAFSLIKNYDYVLVNSPSANILPVSIITKLFRKKLIVFHQGDLILPKGIINLIIEKVFDISIFLSFLLADTISTYTDDYARNSRVMKRFKNKTKTAILPISFSKKDKTFDKENEIRSLKKRGFAIFGFAGRFVEEKGFDILFDAIEGLGSEKYKFIFAGEIDIAYENFFSKNRKKFMKIKNKIIMLGLLDEEQMTNFYNLIDFIVIPSRSDCFNLVQAEAMLSGKPSIVSNVPGARHLVKKSGFGLIFTPNNTNSLAIAIKELVKKRKSLLKNINSAKSLLNNKENAEKFKKIITR